MNIKVFQGGFDKNLSYLIWCDKTSIAAIIDPSVEINPIIEYIASHNLILSKILITHTHHDHIAYIHDFINLYSNISNYCYKNPVNVDFNYTGLSHNQVITIGNDILIAIHTPGHFIDSMCFWNKKDNCIFTGDTMFVGRTGRTVSNLSNIKDLYNSTYKKLLIGFSHKKGQIRYKKIHFKKKKNNSELIVFLSSLFFIKSSIMKNKAIKKPTYIATILICVVSAANIASKNAL